MVIEKEKSIGFICKRNCRPYIILILACVWSNKSGALENWLQLECVSRYSIKY